MANQGQHKKAKKTLPKPDAAPGQLFAHMEEKIAKAQRLPVQHAAMSTSLQRFLDEDRGDNAAWFGYIKFMSLKAAFQDWDSTYFSPRSEAIDAIWHKHLLWDAEAYGRWCMEYSKGFINHTHITDTNKLRNMAQNTKRCELLCWPDSSLNPTRNVTPSGNESEEDCITCG